MLGASGLFAVAFELVTSIPFMVMNSPHYDTNMFVMLALTCVLSAKLAIEQSRMGRARILFLAAGLLAGLTDCMIQEKGFFLVVALLAALWIMKVSAWRQFAAWLIAGYGCPWIAELGWYVHEHAIGDLIFCNLQLPLASYGGINSVAYGFPFWNHWLPNCFSVLRAVFPTALATLLTAAMSVPLLFILFLPAFPVVSLLWRKQLFRRDVMPFWLVGLAICASELHRFDLGHLRNASLLFFILFFAFCEISSTRLLKRAATVIAICVVLNGTVDIAGAMSAHTVIHSRRGTLLAQKPDDALNFLLTHTSPGEYVFVYPYAPVYYFLGGVRNPTRLSVLMYTGSANWLFNEAVLDLEKKKVRFVLLDTTLAGDTLTELFPSYHPPPPNQQIVEPYLESHYHQIDFKNGFRILERNR
jgi:hypothetical protein